MFARTDTTVAAWTSPSVAAFQLWVSFFPVAPLFGVEWRFADWARLATPIKVPAKGRAPRSKKAQPDTIDAVYSEVNTAPVMAPRPARAPAERVAPAEAPERADDLKLIKGIGAGLEKQLNALGIRSFAQIAALSDSELADLDARLKTVRGRCFRDDWVGQAKALAA